jgi:hypothetical protein
LIEEENHQKKALIVIIIMLAEAGLLWGVAAFFGWDLMEIFFLGGALQFGVIWLFVFYTTQMHNEMNVPRGWTGQDVGGIKLFQFRLSPVTLGIAFFMILSFCLTAIYYRIILFINVLYI